MEKKTVANQLEDRETHAEHRKRMREKFRNNGPMSFSDHELLEMLLYHVNARSDTNPPAHRLLSTFHDLRGVFTAPFDSLVGVRGVGESSVFLIKLCHELFIRCRQQEEEYINHADVIRTGEDAIALFRGKYTGMTEETVMIACLDNKGRVICVDTFPPGQVNASGLNIRAIVARAIGRNAAGLILAHNHPDGPPDPSEADISATRSLRTVLHSMKIELFDHVIIGEQGRGTSMRDSGGMGLFGLMGSGH